MEQSKMDENNTTVRAHTDGVTKELTEHNPSKQIIVSNEILIYFLIVNLWGPGFVVCMFGIVTNILNIITFIKQGVKDTVNISLLGLATSDLLSQITLLYTNISFFPQFISADFPFAVYDVMYIVAWCHVMFTRVTTWITAYITLERCLCVTLPLKVRNIFTPKRTILYLVLVYLIMLASATPCFYTTRPTLIFVPARNKSVYGVSFIPNRNSIENVAFITNNTIPTVAFCLVVTCTAVLVTNLQKKTKWRQHATASIVTTTLSDRDMKVVKMVILISTIFIMCYLPGAVAFILMLIDKEMRFDGFHVNLMFALFSLLFHLESINAGVNIFIYLSLSSKFKATFFNTFCFCTKKTSLMKNTFQT